MKKITTTIILIASLAVCSFLLGQGNINSSNINCRPTIIIGEENPFPNQTYTYSHDYDISNGEQFNWEVEGALEVDGNITNGNPFTLTKGGSNIDVIWEEETPNGRIKVEPATNCAGLAQVNGGLGGVLVVNSINSKYLECGGDFSESLDSIIDDSLAQRFPNVPQPMGFKGEKYANHTIRFQDGFNYISITAIVLECNGVKSISYNKVMQGINKLNHYYANANIKFLLCDYIVIDSNDDAFVCDYWDYRPGLPGVPSLSLSPYLVPNTVNIFLPNEIHFKDPSTGLFTRGIGGFYSGGDLFYNAAVNFATTTTPSHEIGHYFSLAHTHGNSNFGCGTNEPVLRVDYNTNGTLDCYETGDGLCDTEADPNGSYLCGYRTGCNYNVGYTQDAYGNDYTPDYYNIMSYGGKNCNPEVFTQEQYKKINYILLNNKSNVIIKGFDLDVDVSGTNGVGAVTATFAPNLGNYQTVNWAVRNTACQGPHCGPKGTYDLSNGNTFNFGSFNFAPCNEYEITIEYDVCGETIEETQTIKMHEYSDLDITELSVEHSLTNCSELNISITYNKFEAENISLTYKLTGAVNNTVVQTDNFPKADYFLKTININSSNIVPAGAAAGNYQLKVYANTFNGGECLIASDNFTINNVSGSITTPDIKMPDGYCSGTNNTFTLESSSIVPNVEYVWQLINVVDQSITPVIYPPVSGLNMTSYTPDFLRDYTGYQRACKGSGIRTNGDIKDFTVKVYARNCSGTQSNFDDETVIDVDYATCCSPGGGGGSGAAFKISVSPNPSNGQVNISIPQGDGSMANIRITDFFGTTKKSINTMNLNETINTTDLPLGVYNIIVTKGNDIDTKHLQVLP